MKELGDALKLLFMKIGDFFDIFDLSFFISGIATGSAVVLATHFLGLDFLPALQTKLGFLLGIIGAYISGLVSFAAGRWLRQVVVQKFRRKNSYDDFDNKFRSILEAHGLADEKPYKTYLECTSARGSWRLYVRLWAEVRHNEVVTPSLQLLKRYWVMAATYDGVTISLLLWFALVLSSTLGVNRLPHLPLVLGIPAAFILLVLSISTMREASRYFDYQVEEVVATIATTLKKSNQ